MRGPRREASLKEEPHDFFTKRDIESQRAEGAAFGSFVAEVLSHFDICIRLKCSPVNAEPAYVLKKHLGSVLVSSRKVTEPEVRYFGFRPTRGSNAATRAFQKRRRANEERSGSIRPDGLKWHPCAHWLLRGLK